MSRIYHYHYCMERSRNGILDRLDGLLTFRKPVYTLEDYRWMKAEILKAHGRDSSDPQSWTVTSLSLHDPVREEPAP